MSINTLTSPEDSNEAPAESAWDDLAKNVPFAGDGVDTPPTEEYGPAKVTGTNKDEGFSSGTGIETDSVKFEDSGTGVETA